MRVPGFTFLYAWTSISVAISALIRLVLLRSSSLQISLAVDLLLMPALLHLIGVEIELGLRAILPTACRCVVSAVFTYGVHALPRSFTLGEALLVAQGVGMTAFDLMLYSLHRVKPPICILLSIRLIIIADLIRTITMSH